jgi:hypothetical protein
VELYGPIGSKRKIKTLKRILNNPTKMELENEKIDLKFERINSDSSGSRTFSSANNKSQIHINFDSNK